MIDRALLVEEIQKAESRALDMFQQLRRVPDVSQDLVSLAMTNLNVAYALTHMALHVDQPTAMVQGSVANPFSDDDEDEEGEEEDDGKLSIGAVVMGAVSREDKLVDWIKRFQPFGVPARQAKGEAIKHIRTAFMWLPHATRA